MSLEGLKTGLRTICDWILHHMSVMMSLALIAYGIVYVIYYQGDKLYAVGLSIMPILCGILILLDKHRSTFWAVGLYAIGIGVAKLILYVPGVFAESTMTFVISLIASIMAGNLVYSGSRYLRGNARSILFVLLGTTALIIITGIVLALDFQDLADLPRFVQNNLNSIFSLAVYIMYIGLVWSEPVRNSTDVATNRRLSSGIRAVDGTMTNATIHESSVPGIVDFIKGVGPGNGTPEGPIFSEYCFAFKDKFRTNYARLQRWNGPDGDIYLVLSDHEKGSFIYTSSTLVKDVRTADNAVFIVFADRGEAVFKIRDVNEEDGPIIFGKTETAGGDAA